MVTVPPNGNWVLPCEKSKKNLQELFWNFYLKSQKDLLLNKQNKKVWGDQKVPNSWDSVKEEEKKNLWKNT